MTGRVARIGTEVIETALGTVTVTGTGTETDTGIGTVAGTVTDVGMTITGRGAGRRPQDVIVIATTVSGGNDHHPVSETGTRATSEEGWTVGR